MGGWVVVRGGGDLASGVVLRLARAGVRVAVAELAQPVAVRRAVSFAQVVIAGELNIEGITGRRVEDAPAAERCARQGEVPVWVDPTLAAVRAALRPLALVDGRMTKRPPDIDLDAAPLVIGLGPGFTAGRDCHAVVETQRGPALGRVYWTGQAAPNTGQPERVGQHQEERVLRAPADGALRALAEIGERVAAGQVIAEVAGQAVRAPFRGVLRGLVLPGLWVSAGMKIGDIDPRDDPLLAFLVSDKALAVGGGVLEALLTRAEIRARLWAD